MNDLLLFGALALSAGAAGFTVGKMVSDAQHEEGELELTAAILRQNATIQLQSAEIERQAGEMCKLEDELEQAQ